MNAYIIIGIIVIAIGGLVGSYLIYYGQKKESDKETYKQIKHRKEMKDEIVSKIDSSSNEMIEKIETDKSEYLKVNKPLLSINYREFKDGSKIQIEKNNDSIYVSFHFIIKNIGNVAAQDIRISKLIPGDIQNVRMNLANTDPGNMSLGPGEAVGLNLGFTYIPDDINQLEDSYNNFNSGDYEVGLGLFYEHELDSDINYLRKFSIKVNQKDITIIGYEHKIIEQNKN